MQLIPQPHGGALLPGGKKGNRGGLGQLSNELRANLRQVLSVGLPRLMEIAEGKLKLPRFGVCEACGHEHDEGEVSAEQLKAALPTNADILRAIDVAAKHGLAKQGFNEELVKELFGLVEEHVEPDTADAIRRAWAKPLAKQLIDAR